MRALKEMILRMHNNHKVASCASRLMQIACRQDGQVVRMPLASRFAAWQLAPEHWGQGESKQVVQGPPGQISIHQRLVDCAWGCQCIAHRFAGHLCECDPLHADPLERLCCLCSAKLVMVLFGAHASLLTSIACRQCIWPVYDLFMCNTLCTASFLSAPTLLLRAICN